MRRLGFFSFVLESVFLLGAFHLAGLGASSLTGIPALGNQTASPTGLWMGSTIFGLVVAMCLYFSGLYDFHARFSSGELRLKLLRSLAISLILLWVVYLLLPGLSVGRGALLLAIALSSAFLLPWRHFVMGRVRQSIRAERILIVGSDEAALDLARRIEIREHLGYSFLGFVAHPKSGTLDFDDKRLIGTPDQVLELARERKATKIVVAQQDTRGRISLDTLLECKTLGIPVFRAADFYEKLTRKILLDDVRIKSWLIFSEGFVVSKTLLSTKRALDLIVSGISLILVAPLMAIIAIIVRCDSPGSVLYRQERVGRNGKPFVIIKFRTMKKDAERDTGPCWAKRSLPTACAALRRSPAADSRWVMITFRCLLLEVRWS